MGIGNRRSHCASPVQPNALAVFRVQHDGGNADFGKLVTDIDLAKGVLKTYGVARRCRMPLELVEPGELGSFASGMNVLEKVWR